MKKRVVHKDAEGASYRLCDWNYDALSSYFWKNVTCKRCLKARPRLGSKSNAYCNSDGGMGIMDGDSVRPASR